MNEQPRLKRDFLSGDYAIIAEGRRLRPGAPTIEHTAQSDGACPFCAGNEHLTPDAVYNHKNVRCFANKYPAVVPDIETHSGKALNKNDYGFHEVLVDTPFHGHYICQFTTDEIVEVFKGFAARMEVFAADKKTVFSF